MNRKVRDKKSWKRRLLFAAGLLALLVVTLYLALTSTAFLRAFVLPRVGAFLGAEITVGDMALQPFSRIELNDLRVQTGDREPFLEIERVRARYDGWALLRGRLVVHECEIVGPRVQLLRVEGGRDNLPLRFHQARPDAGPPTPRRADTGAPTPLILRNLSLTNAFVRVVDRDRAGLTTSTTFSNLTARLDRVEGGEAGVLTLGGALHAARTSGAGGSNDFFEARAGGEFKFETGPALKLDRVEGRAQFTVTEAGGALRDLAALEGRLDTLLEGTALTRCEFAFAQRGVRVGTARVTGTFDPAKTEGQLRVVIDSINRQVLNLVAARYGVEFQQSGVGANFLVSLAQGGHSVSAEGQLVGRQLAVRRGDAITPALDGDLDFNLRADRVTRRVHLQKLQLLARQGTVELVAGRLDYPMDISWATNAATSFTKSTLSLALSQCDLAAWRALHGQTNVMGEFDARIALTTLPGGQLQFTGTAQARRFGAGPWRQAHAELTVTANYSVTNGAEVFAGTASLRAPEAGAGDAWPAALAADAEFELARGPTGLELRPGALRLSRAGAPAGTVSFAGSHLTKDGTGELRMKLAGVNEHLLGEFMAPALTPRPLASALLEGELLMKLGTAATTTLDVNLALSRVARAPVSPGAVRQAATLQLALESRGAIHQLKRGVLNFAPGATPPNELEFTGLLDLRAEKPEPSRLSLQAASLDLTSWWNTLAAPAGASPTTAPPSDNPRDPEPLSWPVRQCALEARLGTVRARHILASNVILTARLSDGLLAVKPFEATLNGAPVRGLLDANLAVPGWLYNVDLALDRLPLRPLIESFTTGSTRTAGGELTLNGEFKGAGLTYGTLRHKLNGTGQFTLTNAAIEFGPGWRQGVLLTVATLLRAPEIAGGPIAWARGAITVGGGQLDLQGVNVGTGAFLAGLTGRIPLAESLTNSPLDLPITLQLRRSLADRAKLTVAGPPDAPFAALPDFLRLKGKLGKPGAKINKVALGDAVLQSLGNVPGLGDEKSRAILQGLGEFLAPPKAATTNAPASPSAPPRQ